MVDAVLTESPSALLSSGGDSGVASSGSLDAISKFQILNSPDFCDGLFLLCNCYKQNDSGLLIVIVNECGSQCICCVSSIKIVVQMIFKKSLKSSKF